MSFEHFFFHLSLLFVALSANFFSALAGGGAGLIQLPALILLGLPFHTALATHKIASVALGIGASYRYLHAYPLNSRLVALIIFCGLPGVFLGAHFVLLVPAQLLNLILGVFTILLGIYSSSNKDLGAISSVRRLNLIELALGGIVLFFIGFLNGSISSGSGLFVTIWLVFWFGLDYSLAVAYTLIFVGLAWNSLGALVVGMDINVSLIWLPTLLIGSLIGGYLGSHVAILRGSQAVKKAFEILALGVGISLLFKAYPF